MKTFTTLVSFGACIFGASSGLAAPSVDSLDLINLGVGKVDVSAMPHERREAYIVDFKARYPAFTHFLIRLRDATTITQTMAKWEASGGQTRWPRQDLEKCASPWMLPLLAQYLHRDEPTTIRRPPTPEDMLDSGFSHVTAMVMRQIIVASPEIPEAAKAWCRGYVYPHDDDPKQVHEMRLWWEANRRNLERERYDLLVPLPANPSSVPTEPAPATSIEPQPKTSPTNQSAAPSPTPSTSAPDTISNPMTFWTWGVGAVVATLALGFLWIKRR